MSEEKPYQRLRAARERAGFRTASDAARRIGAKVVTYTAHENGGRDFDRVAALEYARKFNVDPAWLMFGDLEAVNGTAGSVLKSVKNGGRSMAKTSSGLPQVRASENAMQEDYWQMPDQFVRDRLKIQEERARVLEVRGDSMYDPASPTDPGSMYPGDRVIVDIGDICPTPPGPFVINDGAGLIIKIVEVVPFSNPMKLRLSSRNPRYATCECPATDAEIVGRVKAKVSMLV